MARADAAAVLTVEILVEEHQVLEMWIFGVAAVVAVTRAFAVRARQKDARQPPCELRRDLLQIQVNARAGRIFHLERITIIVVVALEGLDDQIVEWEPNGTAPVRIATEQARRRVS